jgi:hypothetical protein
MSNHIIINNLDEAVEILRQFAKLTRINTLEISAALACVAAEHADSAVRKAAAHACFIVDKHIETAERTNSIPAAYHAMLVAFKLHDL